MNQEQMIHLAEKIASQLPEVTRNEWIKWTQIADTHGLEKAIRWAERMAQDVTLRPSIKRANQLIAEVIRAYSKTLNPLPVIERRLLFGYISRILAIKTLRGFVSNKSHTES